MRFYFTLHIFVSYIVFLSRSYNMLKGRPRTRRVVIYLMNMLWIVSHGIFCQQHRSSSNPTYLRSPSERFYLAVNNSTSLNGPHLVLSQRNIQTYDMEKENTEWPYRCRLLFPLPHSPFPRTPACLLSTSTFRRRPLRERSLDHRTMRQVSRWAHQGQIICS